MAASSRDLAHAVAARQAGMGEVVSESMVSVREAAQMMNVSERSVYQAKELQRCRPDLAAQCKSGELTIREALRIANPVKYAKRDKVQQWLASYRAWDSETRARALDALAELTEKEPE